jgi:hypothetical protein
MKNWEISEEAAKLHRDAFVWDTVFPFFDFHAFSLALTGAQAGQFDRKYKELEKYAAASLEWLVSMDFCPARFGSS